MIIMRRSPRTGRDNQMDLPVTQAQLDEFTTIGKRRTIQEIFPDLTPAQREFIMTGYTQEDWDAIFGPEK